MKALHLLGFLLAALCANADAAVSSAPIERHIVDSLTPVLIQHMEQANLSLLLVLPGAASHASMQLQWQQVTDAVERLNFVYDHEGFMSNWHGYHRYHRWHQIHGSQQHGTAGSSSGGTVHHAAPDDAPLEPSEFDDIHPLVNPTPPKVALLLHAENGAVRSSLTNLATAVTRRLGHVHVRTFVYSTHQDKGDSLLVFDQAGVPLQASFLSTAVFRDAFTAIYNKRIWGAGGGGSGDGSAVPYTATIRAALPALIQKYQIRSMLDSSCGSMHWMPLVLREVQDRDRGFRFMGTDVVCSLISQHLVTFKHQVANNSMNFQCVDYSNQPLPRGYDLVFSRDSLQHLPMHGTWQFLNNVKASGAKYLLVGSYIDSASPNGNIRSLATGDAYPIDLLKAPFKASPPLEIIDEQTPDGKHMLLFDVQKMTWTDTLDGLV